MIDAINPGVIMEDRGDWDVLASEMVRQNCAFVASCSLILWECLITFDQEVQYVWHCPSKMAKYLFLFCRYWTVCYSIVYSIFGIQWTPHIPIPRRDCRRWFFIHVASVSLLYTGSQLTLIRKIFGLYGRSAPLAVGLFALQCIQVTGILILSHRISGSLNFNPICNGVDLPNLTFSVLYRAAAACIQCTTWALILRKVWGVQTGFFAKWRRYLYTSETYARMSWGLAFAAIALNTWHSFAHQRIAPVYILTFPMTVLSIGTCRYILRVEKDRDARGGLKDADNIDAVDKGPNGKGKQRATTDQLPITRPSYSPQPPPVIPSPSDSEMLSTLYFSTSTESARHSSAAVVSNFPYLYGAESYKFKGRNTTKTSTDSSLRSLSDYASQQSASGWTPRSRNLEARVSSGSSQAADSADAEMLNANAELQNADADSASDIDIGSMHSSSSVDSEQLRRFYNDTWNAGPFMVAGP